MEVLIKVKEEPVVKNQINFMMDGGQIYDRELCFRYGYCSLVPTLDVEIIKNIRR